MENVEVYEVQYLNDFDKSFERLSKKKKFKILPKQINELINDLEQGKFEGDKITHTDEPTPYDVYKIRLPNLDTSVGKSNGYRVIYMVVTESKIVVFLTIYYKKEQPTVSDVYIKGLIDGYFLNSLPEE
ncbi:MAG: type II toxin-antitoxin system RelE/ParE family toxin [Endomicrobia bacterium]|nr:type II toxin-antitoxin system RelE/ParE family toxin [Endomicrobiia bacterium]